LFDYRKLLNYIAYTKIGDGTWNGIAQALLLHWQAQIRLYDKLVSSTRRLSDTTKKVMLETAIHPIDTLLTVKIQTDQMKATNGRTLSYVEYSRLVVSEATNYDSEFVNLTSKSTATGCCSAYAHELQNELVTDEVDTENRIDIGIDTIKANVKKCNQTEMFLTKLPSMDGNKCPKKRKLFGKQFPKVIRISFL
jgi:hypothetical protein